MRKTLLFAAFIAFISGNLWSQDNKTADSKLAAKFGGFVKAEAIYDQRIGEDTREGLFYFYPKNVKFDAQGNDLNEISTFNQYAVSTRGNVLLNGYNAFGAKASALIEGDFTGASNSSFNALRLRHAYVKFNWVYTELLMGQYWHPFNMAECIPGVQSLNTGAPFHPFSRQLQTRFSANIGQFKIVAAASSQRDNMDDGVNGPSVEYLRNSAIPTGDLQVHYKLNGFEAGIGGNFKRIVPRTITDKGIKTDEKLDCYSAVGYMRLKTKPVIVKLQSVLGQNLYEYGMMGGYGVDSINPLTDHRTYTPLNQFTVWGDVVSNTEIFQAGLFAGYAQNLGSLNNITGKLYGRGNDLAYVYRVSPRLIFNSGKVSFTAECEYTVAGYGTPKNRLYEIKDVKEVNNVRVLVAAIFNF